MAQQKAPRVKAMKTLLRQAQTTAPATDGGFTTRVEGEGFTTRADRVPAIATQVRIETALYEAFRAKCFNRRESMSYVMEQLVRDWVERPS